VNSGNPGRHGKPHYATDVQRQKADLEKVNDQDEDRRQDALSKCHAMSSVGARLPQGWRQIEADTFDKICFEALGTILLSQGGSEIVPNVFKQISTQMYKFVWHYRRGKRTSKDTPQPQKTKLDTA
jgi:hypothetical protein